MEQKPNDRIANMMQYELTPLRQYIGSYDCYDFDQDTTLGIILKPNTPEKVVKKVKSILRRISNSQLEDWDDAYHVHTEGIILMTSGKEKNR